MPHVTHPITLLDHLGLERATLVCHDMGGLVAWEQLGRAPNRAS